MTTPLKLKRIPGNTNLRYWHEATYGGYPLMLSKGPFIEQYLEKLYRVMLLALSDYRSVFAFRVDLNLPLGKKLSDDAMTNQVIERFNASLQQQIDWDRQRAQSRNGSAHGCRVRNFWVREVGSKAGRPHYHCIVFLNRDAYRSLGHMDSDQDNMCNRLKRAWARALGLSVADIAGTLHLPQAGTFNLTRTDELGREDFFHRSSYLCKSATKHYGDGQHGCGGSRC